MVAREVTTKSFRLELIKALQGSAVFVMWHPRLLWALASSQQTGERVGRIMLEVLMDQACDTLHRIVQNAAHDPHSDARREKLESIIPVRAAVTRHLCWAIICLAAPTFHGKGLTQ